MNRSTKASSSLFMPKERYSAHVKPISTTGRAPADFARPRPSNSASLNTHVNTTLHTSTSNMSSLSSTSLKDSASVASVGKKVDSQGEGKCSIKFQNPKPPSKETTISKNSKFKTTEKIPRLNQIRFLPQLLYQNQLNYPLVYNPTQSHKIIRFLK